MIGLHSKANTLSPVIIVGRKGSFGKIQYSLFPCFCDDKLVKIDKCIAIIEKEIKLTQEYRTTLISETVTGKIDVRKYHPPQ